jgi:hypothetical protein
MKTEKLFMKKLIILLISFVCFKSQALVIDMNLNNFSDSLSTSTDSKSSRLFGSVGLLADLTKSDSARINFGFTILSISSKTEIGANTSETFSSLDMGPAIRWSIDSKRMFSLTFVYAIYGKGKYDTATTSSTITGSSYYLKAAVEPQIADNLNLGFALNYYSSQYSTSVTNSVESSVSYKSSWIFPSLSLALRF